MPRKTLKQRRERDAARELELSNDTTIGGRILEKSRTTAGTDADWFANELYMELSAVSEERFPQVGELCYFSYGAAFGDKYPWWDKRPLAYILDIKLDHILGANLHYYNPDIRSSLSLIHISEPTRPY